MTTSGVHSVHLLSARNWENSFGVVIHIQSSIVSIVLIFGFALRCDLQFRQIESQ